MKLSGHVSREYKGKEYEKLWVVIPHKLIEKLGGEIVECAFIINLSDLGGKEKLSKYPVFSIVDFEGE